MAKVVHILTYSHSYRLLIIALGIYINLNIILFYVLLNIILIP